MCKRNERKEPLFVNAAEEVENCESVKPGPALSVGEDEGHWPAMRSTGNGTVESLARKVSLWGQRGSRSSIVCG